MNLADGHTGQEQSHGVASQSHDDHGIDDLDLTVKVTTAVCDFVRLRITVLRRTGLDDIGDIHVLTVETGGIQHSVEKLSGIAYEGSSGLVLGLAGSFTDEHDQPRHRLH